MEWILQLIVLIKIVNSITGAVIDHEQKAESQDSEQASVMIVILVRNKAHILPYFLYCLENMDYPKDRISLW